MLIDNVNVNEDDWKAFLCVRQDGQYNMWSPHARDDANLNKETWLAIINNFDKLVDKWGELR